MVLEQGRGTTTESEGRERVDTPRADRQLKLRYPRRPRTSGWAAGARGLTVVHGILTYKLLVAMGGRRTPAAFIDGRVRGCQRASLSSESL